MVEIRDPEDLRRSALEHLWMSSDWAGMAEVGGPTITMEGRGIKMTDSEGRTWIDAMGGYASVHLGYGRTEIAEAVREQMLKMPFFPQGTTTEPLVRLTEKLAQITPGSLERTWPVTGGSEANETAVKIARAYHHRNGEPGRYKIISRKGSYHGATGGVTWTGSDPRYTRTDYEPAYPGMIYAPQPNPRRCELGGQTASECAVLCAQAIEDLIVFHGPKTVAAVIGEPMTVGILGIAVPGDEYWPMVREICDRYGVLLIADEVICGFGRMGTWFGMDRWGVVPDVMAMGKGIVSSYLPFAATIATKEVADAFAGEENIFRQVLTNGGHPASAAAALKNIEIIESEGLVQNSAEMGAYFIEQLESLSDQHPMIGDVWGLGLVVAVELVSDHATMTPAPAELEDKFLQQRLIISCVADKGLQHIRINPPLCITSSEVDEIIDIIDRTLGEVEREVGLSR